MGRCWRNHQYRLAPSDTVRLGDHRRCFVPGRRDCSGDYGRTGEERGERLGLELILGLLSVIAGLIFLFGSPILSVVVLVILLAGYVIMTGVTLIMLSLAVRKAATALAQTMTE